MRRARLMIGVMRRCGRQPARRAAGRMADRFVTAGHTDCGRSAVRGRCLPRVQGEVPAQGLRHQQRRVPASGTMSARGRVESRAAGCTFRVMLSPTAGHHMQVASAYRKIGIFDKALRLSRAQPRAERLGPTTSRCAWRGLWRDWGNPGAGLAHAYQAVCLRARVARGPEHAGHRCCSIWAIAPTPARDSRRAVRLDSMAAYALDNLCTVHMAEGRTRRGMHDLPPGEGARIRSRAGPPFSGVPLMPASDDSHQLPFVVSGGAALAGRGRPVVRPGRCSWC